MEPCSGTLWAGRRKHCCDPSSSGNPPCWPRWLIKTCFPLHGRSRLFLCPSVFAFSAASDQLCWQCSTPSCVRGDFCLPAGSGLPRLWSSKMLIHNGTAFNVPFLKAELNAEGAGCSFLMIYFKRRSLKCTSEDENCWKLQPCSSLRKWWLWSCQGSWGRVGVC